MIRMMKQQAAQGGGGGDVYDPSALGVELGRARLEAASSPYPTGEKEQERAAKNSELIASAAGKSKLSRETAAKEAQNAMEAPGRARMMAMLTSPGATTWADSIDPITFRPKESIINNPKNYWANLITSHWKGTKMPNFLDFMPKLPKAMTQSTDVQAGYERAVTEFGGDPRLETRNMERDPVAFGNRGAEFLEAAGKYAGEARGWEDPNTEQPIPISGIPRKDDPSMALWGQGLESLSPEEFERLKTLFSKKWRQ
jgi:hypothetical protein